MTLKVLNKAIEDFDSGLVSFQARRNYHCFRCGIYWYPLRAVTNHALGLSGVDSKTLNESVLIMAAVVPALTVIEVDLTIQTAPVALTESEKKHYIKSLVAEAHQLLKN
jgi:hypothetical protein